MSTFSARAGHRLLVATTVLSTALLSAAPARAQATAGAELKRLRARVEGLLQKIEAQGNKLAKTRLEAARDRKRTRELAQQLSAIQARAAEARKKLQKEIAAAKAAEAALAAEAAKAKKLQGFHLEAWKALRKKRPADPRAAVLAMALEREAIIAEVLARKLAAPQQRAVAAYAAVVRAAGRSMPEAPLARLGRRARPSPAAARKIDALGRLDALARSMEDVTSCSAVDTPAIDLPPPLARVAPAKRVGASAKRLTARMRAVLRKRQVALSTRGRSTSRRALRAVLGSRALTRAAADAAVTRGWRSASWAAARTALGAFAAIPGAEAPRAPYPRSTRKLLEKLEKERGFGCEPAEDRP